MKYILALLADWANGLFAVLLAGSIAGVEPVWWHFLIGILLSHSPDIDAVPELLRHGRVGANAIHEGDHRDGLHYPLPWLLISGVSAYVFGYFGWIFLIAVVLHFINDLYGTGWGIKVSWPFSRTNYKVLGRRVNRMKGILIRDGEWVQVSPDERKLQFIVSWSPEELPHYIQRWGISNWIEEYYLRLNWISVTEYVFFVIVVTWTLTTLL